MKSLKLVLVISILVIGCDNKTEVKIDKAPIKVGISTVLESKIVREYEFTGLLVASESVRIMPMINGFVDEVSFKEGSFVHAGDLLYKIDARKILTHLNKSKADVRKYKSILENQKMNLTRSRLLHERKYINDAEYEDVRHNYEEAKADFEAKIAELNAVKRDLSYASIVSPIDGKVGISAVKKGEYIEQGESILVDVINTSPIYVEFDVPQSIYENMKSLGDLHEHNTKVEIKTFDQKYLIAKLNFSDNRYNTASNSIKLRAELDNTKGDFIPGAYTEVKISIPSQKRELLIDQSAVKNIQGINSAYRVANGIAIETKVALKSKYKNYWILEEGLNLGDVIINEGIQSIKNGDSVISIKEKELATNP